MIGKRTFAIIFFAAAACFAGFAQAKGNVVVLQTELQNISGNAWLSNHIQSLIEENLQKYTDFATVVDAAAEQKVKEQQRRSESTAHSESDIIEIGKLVNAKYAVFSSVRKTGSAYMLSIDFTDLTTGVHRASITSRQYDNLEALYAHPSAVDEVTLSLCDRLGIALSAAQKYVLQHGEDELSVNQQLELEKKEQKRFRQQLKDLDTQIAALNTSAQTDAVTQQKKLEALHAINEQKLKAAQEREQRLLAEQKRRQEDMLAEANRKEASIQRRNSMSDEIERKVKNVRAAKVQNFNIMERIAFLETKKKTFNELQEELAKRKEEIDLSADEEFKLKKAEIESRSWRAAELADGKPTVAAKERRNGEIEDLFKKLHAQAEKEKSAVEKELQPAKDALLNEIIADYRFLENTTVTISSIKNEKDIQYGIGTFNGDKNVWSVLLYFYNDGKESLGQYQTSVPYQVLTGKKPFAEMNNSIRGKEQEELAYNDFLDTVDMYNSLFARREPVLTYEVDYTVEPWSIPSQYRICFKELRIKDTVSEKTLLKEAISTLDKIVSFPECRIQTEYYAQIISPAGKNVPLYLLYEFALAAEKNGNDTDAANLMRRAAEKNYTPALEYIKTKEAETREEQRLAAVAKANEEERKRQEKIQIKNEKKTQNDALYRSVFRLGFSFGGDFSPSIQNYAFEMKGIMVCWTYGLGANIWLRNGKWDAVCGYGSLGFLVSLERICLYAEGGFGIGNVDMSKNARFGGYFYGKAGLELRISPRVSIDVFCKSQETSYSETVLGESVNRSVATAVSGGIGITYWKVLKK